MAAQPLREHTLELLKQTEGCDEAELARRKILVVRRGEIRYNSRIDLDSAVGRNDFDPEVIRGILETDLLHLVQTDIIRPVQFAMKGIDGVIGDMTIEADPMYLVKVLAKYDSAFPVNSSRPPYSFRKGEAYWLSNRQAELALFEELKRTGIAQALWEAVVKDVERTGVEHRYEDKKNPQVFYREFSQAKSVPVESITLDTLHRFDRWENRSQVNQRLRNLTTRIYASLAKYGVIERKGAHQFAAKTYMALNQENAKIAYKTE